MKLSQRRLFPCVKIEDHEAIRWLLLSQRRLFPCVKITTAQVPDVKWLFPARMVGKSSE